MSAATITGLSLIAMSFVALGFHVPYAGWVLALGIFILLFGDL